MRPTRKSASVVLKTTACLSVLPEESERADLDENVSRGKVPYIYTSLYEVRSCNLRESAA
jgi:hypothetical protein